jgi:hypothetical protein
MTTAAGAQLEQLERWQQQQHAAGQGGSEGGQAGGRVAVRARISLVDRVEYGIRSRGAKLVVLALVANTLVA